MHSVQVTCPCCGQEVELLVDPGGGPHQEYVEDCEICCRPWRVTLRVDPAAGVLAEVRSLDEG